jgi:hypothetical protein
MALVTDLRDDLLALIRSTTSNAAVQRIYELGPDFWSVTSGGAQVRAPASITGLTLVNGETSISGTGLATWMHGCTVQLSGEAQQNEIRVTSAIPAYALANPYQGTGTSSATGTVYHDAINLAASVTKIEPPVFLAGKWELYPADDPRDQYSPNYYSTDHGRRRHHAGFLWETEKNVGTPEVYTVERNLTYANEITARTIARHHVLAQVSPAPCGVSRHEPGRRGDEPCPAWLQRDAPDADCAVSVLGMGGLRALE